MTLLWWWLVPMSYIRWILHGNYFARCPEETPTPPSIFLGLTWHKWKVNMRPVSPGWLKGLEGLSCVQEVVSSNPSRYMSVIPIMKCLTLQNWWCDCLLFVTIVSWSHSCNHGKYGLLLVQTLLLFLEVTLHRVKCQSLNTGKTVEPWWLRRKENLCQVRRRLCVGTPPNSFQHFDLCLCRPSSTENKKIQSGCLEGCEFEPLKNLFRHQLGCTLLDILEFILQPHWWNCTHTDL